MNTQRDKSEPTSVPENLTPDYTPEPQHSPPSSTSSTWASLLGIAAAPRSSAIPIYRPRSSSYDNAPTSHSYSSTVTHSHSLGSNTTSHFDKHSPSLPEMHFAPRSMSEGHHFISSILSTEADSNRDETTPLRSDTPDNDLENNQDPDWFEYEDVLIHIPSFLAGIMLIKSVGASEVAPSRDTSPTQSNRHLNSEFVIQLKDRQIYFSTLDSAPSVAATKSINLYNFINQFAKPKHEIYLTTDLSDAVILCQYEYVLLKTKYQLELYSKDSSGFLVQLPIKSNQLTQILLQNNIDALLKKKTPCKLDVSAKTLEKFENDIDKLIKIFICITNEAYPLKEVPPECKYILTVLNDELTLYYKNSNETFKAVNMKSDHVRDFISDIALESRVNDCSDRVYVKLSRHQHDKIDSIAEHSNRTMMIVDKLPDQTSPDVYYYLIKHNQEEKERNSSPIENISNNKPPKAPIKIFRPVMALELYYKNNYGSLIKVGMSSPALQQLMTELELMEAIQNNDIDKLTINQITGLEEAIQAHTTMLAYNKKRSDEVYVSMPDIGLYAHPWFSKKFTPSATNNLNDDEAVPYNGFKRFHTVGCLFGSTLQGIDKLGRTFPVFKHDTFHRPNLSFDEKIAAVMFNHKAANPYEEMLFNELKKIAKFINTYGDHTEKPSLVYHLPHIDYVLFGLSLLAIDSIAKDDADYICYDVLETLFIKIFYQKNKHAAEIKKIFSHADIPVQIESPFENLFEPDVLDKEFKSISTKLQNKEKMDKRYPFTRFILEKLGLLDTINSDQKHIVTTIKNENELTQHLIHLLQTNNHKPQQKNYWNDFIFATQEEHKTELAKLTASAEEAKKALLCFEEAHKNASHIEALHNHLKSLAVTPMSKMNLSRLVENANKNPSEESIDALLAFGSGKLKIDTIEKLFKIGNSALLAAATQDCKEDYDLCSILPTSEKQIQLYNDKLSTFVPESKETPYHGTLNITYLPTAISAEPCNPEYAGLFYYYSGAHATSLAKVINKLKVAAESNLLLHALSKSQRYGDVKRHFITPEFAISEKNSPLITALKSSLDNEDLKNLEFKQ